MTASVEVRGLGKLFRRYAERNQSLKSTVLRGGRAKYEALWALRDVSLDIEQGSTYGLIGDNGSGKSTLLKCLARILVPDEGSTVVRGKVAALLELGSGFHPELTGRQNVFLNGAILGMTRRELEHRFDDIVGFAGLEDAIDQPVKNYSSGMYVRLGFSVATNVDPEVLLIDEVLAVGDATFQRRCMERINDLRGGGATVVIVSHAAESMRSLCDEVAWLESGRVVEFGEAGQVIDRYLRSGVEERPEVVGDADRWGNGQVLVEEVHLVDENGRPTTKVDSAGPAVLRVHWRAPHGTIAGIVGAAISAADGTHLWGHNTALHGLEPLRFEGRGIVEWRTDRLALQPGVYDIDISATDPSSVTVFDYRRKIVRFDVQPGGPGGVGHIALDGSWGPARLRVSAD